MDVTPFHRSRLPMTALFMSPILMPSTAQPRALESMFLTTNLFRSRVQKLVFHFPPRFWALDPPNPPCSVTITSTPGHPVT